MQSIGKSSVDEFVSFLISQERSEATTKKYRRDIEALGRFLGEETLCKENVLKYKRLISDSYAPASTNSMLAAINNYMKWLGRHDCVVRYIRMQQQCFRSRSRVLEQEEYFKLLDAAQRAGKLRLFFLMQTICSTGIRVSELEFITVEAVKRGWALVKLKGKTRRILLPSSLCRQLESYALQKHIASGSIFITRSGIPMDRSNILHEMKRLCSDAGVDRSKVFPHNLRHLFACEYYKQQHDLSRLADILGHSSVNTTRIYTSLSGEEHQHQIDSLGLVKQWQG